MISAVVLTASLVLSITGLVGAQLNSVKKNKRTIRSVALRPSRSTGEPSARQALIPEDDDDDILKEEIRNIPDIIPEISTSPNKILMSSE